MSETVKVGRNRPPQNGWASKEEVAELRAEVAELRETNQAMLEEIKGLRAELGGAKRRHFLGAVATSAAAFFGKFFHRGKDLGDFRDEKEHSKGAKKGAHAKGEEKEKEKSDTPIASARKDEKSKNNSREKEEKEDKQNKDKHPLAKKVAAFALAALMVGGSIAGISQCSNHDINGSDAPITEEMDNKDLENHAFGSTQASAEENDAAKAEAAHQQQLAETMGMSVEDMHAVADRHGVNHNDIGTAKAHDQMRDNMESDYNLSEKIDLENMSEAERSERSKQEILFANMNNKYVTAQISSARLGAHDASDSELTQRLFSQYEENDAVWQEHAKENAKFLKESTYSTRSAGTSKTYTYGTENQWDGPIEKQYVVENSGGETVYIVEVANGNTKIQFKDGCIQAVWVEEAAQPRQQVKERTVVQREVVQKQEHQEQGEWRIVDHGHEEGEENTPSDQKDEHADDSQEREQDKNQESPQSKVGSEMTHDKQQHDKDGAPIVDNKGNMNGTQGDTSEDRPANKNNTKADNGGSGSGEHVAGGGATNTGPGNRGGSDEGGTGSNEADSGGRGKEPSQGSQKGGRSWTRDWDSSKGGSWTEDSDGNRTTESHEDSHDTGRVERNGDGNDAAGGNVELQSVPIMEED